MKRLMLILIAAMVCVFPATAMAHSKLESATPAVSSKVDASPQTIEMVFNTKIEKISNFKLFNEAGQEIETGDSNVNGDTMTGTVPTPLENGAYTVKWTIIGADSHAVEGEYSFTVEAPVAPSEAPSQAPSAEPTVAPSPEASVTPAPSEAASEPESEEDPLKSLTSSPLAAVVGIAAVGAVLVIMLRRRKP
ncbi:copper resistance CopC family protein [Paenibacillus soyae]|uniref:Copper resistance protein CopC n=1 Tax=Paenibacillus soyae TaxID=2969249 RepID=A0A9X2MR16_9BACL|nr:copper resistance protein CopC [Paenibacillus soyae]MCR2804805.1 copper resistance protein CopC [Paenibacillus soyae]